MEREENAFELLQALEHETPEPLRKLRESERVSLQAFARVEGSDPSNPMMFEHAAVGDVSRMGCRMMLPTPLQVGAVYKLTLNAEPLDVGTFFARCVRCRLIKEDAYEMGMRFFAPVEFEEEKMTDGF